MCPLSIGKYRLCTLTSESNHSSKSVDSSIDYTIIIIIIIEHSNWNGRQVSKFFIVVTIIYYYRKANIVHRHIDKMKQKMNSSQIKMNMEIPKFFRCLLVGRNGNIRRDSVAWAQQENMTKTDVQIKTGGKKLSIFELLEAKPNKCFGAFVRKECSIKTCSTCMFVACDKWW